MVYYSKDANFCNYLAKNYNSEGVTYIYPDPYTGNNWLMKLIAYGRIDFVTKAVYGVVGSVLAIVILLGIYLVCRKICNLP